MGESELACPCPRPGQQERTIDLTTAIAHAAIVGTPSRQLVWRDEEATRAFAGRLAASTALADAFIALEGQLGAGKTTFVRHLLRALGVQGRVKSPTYAVVEPYTAVLPRDGGPPRDAPVWHFDFYRFDDPREWEDAGFRDIFAGPGLKLAEWPEKAAGVLPAADLVIGLALQPDDSRLVTLTAHTPRGTALLAAA